MSSGEVWVRRAALAACLSAGLVLAGLAQGQSPTFRGGVDIVRTDIAVIDNRTGKPVTGLTDKDFTIKENGVLRPIAGFIAEDGEASGDNSVLTEGGGPAGAGRTILIVLGTGTKEGTSDPYGGTARFIRTRLRPTDRAAVMVMDRVTPLTTDFDTLAQIVERRKRMPSHVNALMRRDGLARQDFGAETQAAIGRWLLPEKAPPNFLRPAAPFVLGLPELNQLERQWERLSSHISSSDLLKVAAGVEYLRKHPGEKRLVLISLIGLAIPVPITGSYVMLRNSADAESLAARAADAGVTLDLVTTYGTPNPPSLEWANALQGAQQIAALTGGEFTSLRTVDQQLARMDEASRFGYVIGYSSGTPLRDGRRREVTIDVNRRDVTLVYRRAFTPRLEAPPINPRALVTRERLEDAAATAADFDDIRIDGSATQVIEGRDARVSFELTIDLNKVAASLEADKIITLDIMALCGDATGATIGSRVQQIKVNLKELASAKYRVAHTMAIPIKGRPTRAKVVVYSYDDDRLGALSLRVR